MDSSRKAGACYCGWIIEANWPVRGFIEEVGCQRATETRCFYEGLLRSLERNVAPMGVFDSLVVVVFVLA